MEDLRKKLQAWVEEKGQVLTEEFLRVDSFLNHRIDPRFVALAASGICQAFFRTEDHMRPHRRGRGERHRL